jgi:hypothetical protein
VRVQRHTRDAAFRKHNIVAHGDLRGVVALGGITPGDDKARVLGVGGGRIASHALDVASMGKGAAAKSHAAARKAAKPRRSKHDAVTVDLTPPDTQHGIGASALQAAATGVPVGAGTSLVDQARAVVYRAVMALLAAGGGAGAAVGQSKGAAKAAAAIAAARDGFLVEDAAGGEGGRGSDEEEEEEEEDEVSPFAQLTAAMKAKFVRDSDECVGVWGRGGMVHAMPRRRWGER